MSNRTAEEARIYRATHRDKFLEYQRKYAKLHPDRINKSQANWKELNPERHKEIKRNWNERHKNESDLIIKIKCRTKVMHAIQNGSLIRPTHCSICLRDGRIEAHHEDYSKPLDIIWMCRCCHSKIHHRLGGMK